MHEAIPEIMQKVYGDIEAHNQAFIKSGYVSIWNPELAEFAEGRWIDTIFGISALMSITTHLSHAKSLGVLCCEHGIPFIKLAEAASINIATSAIKDAQLHLHSLRRFYAKKPEKRVKLEEVENQKKQVLGKYIALVDHARDLVVKQINFHSVEMVFSQYPFEHLIESKWITQEVA